MASYCTLNNANVLRLDFSQPPSGVWTAGVQMEDEDLVLMEGAAVKLSIVGREWSGTIRSFGQPYGQPRALIVGGAGKLGGIIKTKDYGQTTVRAVAQDILSAVKEKAGDLNSLTAVLKLYQLFGESAWEALRRAFTLVPGVDLWCETDGRLSARKMLFKKKINCVVRGVNPIDKFVDLFAEDGTVEPGVIVTTLWGDFNARRVQYTLESEDTRASLNCRVWY